jgi:hypoxanthine-DNA glycosylase
MPRDVDRNATADAGFPPLTGPGARVLVLGSLPGKISIRDQQYYAHPQNAFWRIMGDLFGAHFSLAYEERVKLLTSNRVAVWDVLQSSLRPGSLDSSIRMETAKCNDFPAFLQRNPEIASICFNGKKAAELFARLAAKPLLRQYPHVHLEVLPSTSPAHASMTFAEKLQRWSVVKAASETCAR